MSYTGTTDVRDLDDLNWLAFNTEVLGSGVGKNTASQIVETDIDAIELAELIDVKNPHTSTELPNRTRVWGHLDDHLVHINKWKPSGTLVLEVAGPDAVARLEKILVQVPEVIKADTDVRWTFWTWTPHGTVTYIRPLTAPTWGDIAQNYPGTAQDDLADLMAWHPEGRDGGRIGLLHGPPGTGKTTAIRALARAWEPWCTVHCVADPEVLFDNAAYLFDLLLSERDDDPPTVPGLYKAEFRPQQKWRLVVIEDAEEFLVPDAKAKVGQSVSRLLNVGDGLLGQGTRMLILMSTNAPITDLHPAIKRAGRCFVEIEVPMFTPAEGNRWLQQRGVTATTLADETPLSDLFAKTHPEKLGNNRLRNRPGQYL